ncbi:MAG: amidohydrolase family protein [Alphaproteobacteria bacterium]
MTDIPSFTVIRRGQVLDAAAHRADAADILIAGDTIREIGRPGLDAPEGARVIDAADRLLMPGLINAHTHGHGALAKGLGDRWTLELLLNAGPWLSGGRTLDHKYLAAHLGALEMVRKGCTACYDLYVEIPWPSREGMAAVGRAYADAGMRAVIAPMLADRSFYEAVPGLIEALPTALRESVEGIRLAPAETSLAACRDLLRDWPFDPDAIRLALAPTIPLHCSDAFIVACRKLAREHGVGLHMHLAESKAQAVSGAARYDTTLTAHLDALGLLGPDFTAAHAIWLEADDIRRLADNGASVAHNPGSNMRLGSGLAAVRDMTAAGINVGIGTDGSHCSDNQNMFAAMRFASFASRLRSHDPRDWLATEEVVAMATEGSARALGFGDSIGRLAPGAKADIVFLDLGNLNLLPLNDPTNQLVHSEDGSAVDSVMIGGRMVLADGRFTGVDIARLRARIEAATEELRGLTGDARALALRLEDAVGTFCIGLSRQPYPVHAMAGPDY